MKDISNGYIALYRQFINWEWFTDVKTCHLFQYCLLRANSKNTVWRGINIKRGQFVTSLRTMSIETGLSLQEVRTSLKKLTHELTQLATPSYSIITVVNYNLYQKSNTRINKRLTTDNNIISNTSYIKVSSSSIEEKISKLTEEEEELLKNVSRRNGVTYFQRWLKKVVENNDHISLIKYEQERQQRKEEEERKKREKKKSEEEIKNSPEEEEKIRQIQERIKKRGKKQ